MTENRTTNGSAPAIGAFFPAKPCPPSAPCGPSRVDPAAEPKPYNSCELSYAEAAELTHAKTAAEAEVTNAGAAIDASGRALHTQESKARSALHALKIVRGARLNLARRAMRCVDDRHEKDGPEDRRHRPAWVRWALWLTVPAAGIYDTAFFARIFLKLVDAKPSPTNPVFYISLLPGVVITVALLGTGYLLAQAAVRARTHRERRLHRVRFVSRVAGWLRRKPPTEQTRKADDLPWPQWGLPLSFGLLVITTLGVWAINRAHDASGGKTNTPPVAVALLLLMFSLTAIAIKVLHHNPFADTARTADCDLTAASEQHHALVSTAAAAIGDFDTANRHHRSLLEGIEARIRRCLDQAWARIMEQRHQHGLAGHVAPPFAEGAPTQGHRPLFDKLIEPHIYLEPIESAKRMLRDDDIAALRQELVELLAQIEQDLRQSPTADT